MTHKEKNHVYIVEGELHIRNYSVEIADIFEEILSDNSILIPDDDREGEEDEAAIYGDVYSSFEDAITNILENACLAYVNDHWGVTQATLTRSDIYEWYRQLCIDAEVPVVGDCDEIFADIDKIVTNMLLAIQSNPSVNINSTEY